MTVELFLQGVPDRPNVHEDSPERPQDRPQEQTRMVTRGRVVPVLVPGPTSSNVVHRCRMMTWKARQEAITRTTKNRRNLAWAAREAVIRRVSVFVMAMMSIDLLDYWGMVVVIGEEMDNGNLKWVNNFV